MTKPYVVNQRTIGKGDHRFNVARFSNGSLMIIEIFAKGDAQGSSMNMFIPAEFADGLVAAINEIMKDIKDG